MFLSVFRSNEVDDEDGDYKPVCSLQKKHGAGLELCSARMKEEQNTQLALVHHRSVCDVNSKHCLTHLVILCY